MGNLIRMDIYRMFRAKSFVVCLTTAFIVALAQTPLEQALYSLASVLGSQVTPPVREANFSTILRDPLPMINGMMLFISVALFFYADIENGYIKNIAGQVPRKGYTALSKFIAVIPHNLIFMLVGVAGMLAGTVIFKRIIIDEATLDGLRVFLLKFLLAQGICAILLTVVSALGNKSLGMVLAVLMGLGLLRLAYLGIDMGLKQVFPNMSFSISDYMPDQVLGQSNPDTLTALLVALVSGGIFLPLAVGVVDRKDVK